MISTAIPLRANRILMLTQIAFSGFFSTCAVAQTTAPLPTYPCQPVAYLFRHAEDKDNEKVEIENKNEDQDEGLSKNIKTNKKTN